MRIKNLLPLISLVVPALVMAGGFQNNDLSPRLQGQAMAGAGADAGDLTAIFINPAILATIAKPEVYVGATYDSPKISMKNASAVHGLYAGDNLPDMHPVSGTTGQNQIAQASVLPTFYAALPLSHGFTYGISFTTPWSYNSNYNADSVVRYMAQKTNITSYNLSGLMSYAVDPQLSFAAGIQGQYLSAEFSNFEGVGTEISAPTNQASYMGADNIALGYILGALYSPSDVTHLGISYRSKINSQLHGNGDQYVMAGGQSTTAQCTSTTSSRMNNCHTNVSMDVTTPSVLNMSLVQQMTAQWQLDFTTEITFWSQFDGFTIKTPDAYLIENTVEKDWQNSALFALGSNYQLNSQWTLRGGVGYDQTPTIANTRDARMPDNNKILAALGATYQLNPHFRIDASYEHAFMEMQHLNSATSGSTQRGFPDSGMPVPPQNPYQADQVSADYSGSADMVALGINYLF